MRKWIPCALAWALLVVGANAPAQLITPEGVAQRRGFKAFIYDGLTRAHAAQVEAGTAEPFVYAEVGAGEIPTAYYHYLVQDKQLGAFTDAMELPPGFSLAPISIIRGRAPRHYVTFTVYEVSGERRGLRGEWTTYVTKDGDPTPRTWMLEAWTSEPSLDPVNLIGDPVDLFDVTRDNGTLATEIVDGDHSFSAKLKIPAFRVHDKLDRTWNAASDVLYWSNGVADLQNVNGLVSNRGVAPISRQARTVENRSRWAPFLEARPAPVIVFDERIDYSIRPWFNAADPSVPLDPDFRDDLLAFKAMVFSENERQRAADIAVSMAEPMTDFLVLESPPSVFLNFEVLPDQVDALLHAIPMPEGFEIAPLETIEGTGERLYLSLNVYEAQGIAPGFRAEWSIYVTTESDPVPRYMILEAQSSLPSLDPVDLFTAPADVFQYVNDSGVLRIDVQQAPGTSFQAEIPLPAAPVRVETALQWTEANNLIYWRNGVADKIYYSGLVYDRPMIQVPTATVTVMDGTKWAPYLRLDQVLVFENELSFVASPWNNLNQLAEELNGS